MPRNRKQYLEQVAKFIATNGPAFTLDEVQAGNARSCECCGYYPIMNHYHVSNMSGKPFIIGSECQTWVLNLKDAHLPASQVRALEADKLVELAVKYGLALDPTSPKEDLAKQVIDARRKYANTAGWISRRLQGKAPTKPATADETLAAQLQASVDSFTTPSDN